MDLCPAMYCPSRIQLHLPCVLDRALWQPRPCSRRCRRSPRPTPAPAKQPSERVRPRQTHTYPATTDNNTAAVATATLVTVLEGRRCHRARRCAPLWVEAAPSGRRGPPALRAAGRGPGAHISRVLQHGQIQQQQVKDAPTLAAPA